jgi:2-methylcitrate dehydratase PrpD
MNRTDQGLTAYVADFVIGAKLSRIPEDVMLLGKTSILDGLGCALSGADAPALRILHQYTTLFRSGAGPFATVLGTDLRLPPRFAALINGTAMHVDDYDDTQQAATGKFQGIHPTAPVLSAVLAAGEAADASGAAVLLAYQVGVELACKLFDATHPNHILNGFHATGTCGLLAATIACAQLRGAGENELRHALGIAASQAAGLQENFGTMTKPFHAGHSAEGGIVSTDLAALGFTASTSILEAPRGFFQAEGGGWEPDRIEGRLGQPWAFVDRGVWLKPWPTGSLSHPAMTLMLQLLERHDIQAGQIAAVKIRTSENIFRTLLHHRPQTELAAKFSLEFCTAALAFERQLGLTSFTDAFVCRPDVQDLIGRVEYTTFSEPEARAAGYTIVTSFVDIMLRDGSQVGGKLDYGKGSKSNPMTPDEVEAKFRDCARFASWPEDKTERIIALVGALDHVVSIRELTACLARSPA